MTTEEIVILVVLVIFLLIVLALIPATIKEKRTNEKKLKEFNAKLAAKVEQAIHSKDIQRIQEELSDVITVYLFAKACLKDKLFQ